MTLRFAVLGDSLGFGQGAAHPDDTVGSRLTADLIAAGNPTELRVFAVPGARSDALAAQVALATRWRPDIVLIIIGANDLMRFVPPHQAAAQLGAAVRTLRATGSQIVVAPAPDLTVVSWIPAQAHGIVRAGSTLMRQAQTGAALAAGARVADLSATSAAFAGDRALFSADRVHPSSAGYRLMAAALLPAIKAAAADAANGTN